MRPDGFRQAHYDAMRRPMMPETTAQRTIKNEHGIFRISVQYHDSWYYWTSGDCYGSADSERLAWQRAEDAIMGDCVNCGAHKRATS